MKRVQLTITGIILMTLLATPLHSQSRLLGDWEGRLNTGPKFIRILIHVRMDSSGISSKMDSPDQGAVNLPISQTSIQGDSLVLSDPKMRIAIRGKWTAAVDSIVAVFIQGGEKIPLTFGRTATTGFTLKRPQTPVPPFPYTSEEVVFTNPSAGNIKLAGTLTMPAKKLSPPVAVLISGSGAQNRNEKAFDHEPFLVLSDFLSRNGIAVLRVDDRGVGSSGGNFKAATSLDFSTDAEAAFAYVRTREEFRGSKVGFIGHSEGGMIAPMISSRNPDVAFIVLLAGPAVSIDKLMLKQIEELARFENKPEEELQQSVRMNQEVFEYIRSVEDTTMLGEKIRAVLMRSNYANGNLEAQNAFTKRCLSPWFRYFIRYNPEPALKQTACPILALNGSLDKQVDARSNLEAIRRATSASGNKDVTVTDLPGLNHGFQEAKTGAVAEYQLIEQTMSPIVLQTISKWINERF